MTLKTKGYGFLVQTTLFTLLLFISLVIAEGFNIGLLRGTLYVYIGIIVLNRLLNITSSRRIRCEFSKLKVRAEYDGGSLVQKDLLVRYKAISKAYFSHYLHNDNLVAKEPKKTPMLVLETEEGKHRIILTGFYKKQIRELIEYMKEKQVKFLNESMLNEYYETFYTGIHITHRMKKPLFDLLLVTGIYSIWFYIMIVS